MPCVAHVDTGGTFPMFLLFLSNLTNNLEMVVFT